MELSFLILTWNSEKNINACLKSIFSKCEEENLIYEIIIVDNGSTDSTKNIIEIYRSARPENICIIYLDRNRGTTYPRNLGLQRARGRVICILDSDTEIREGAICMILKHLKANPAIGLISPKLMLTDGSIQNSVKKFPTFWGKLLKIPKAVFKIPMPDFDFYSNFPFTERKEVDTSISACWFFKRELLDVVGFLDEKIFYSPEDLDYCARIRKAGLKIIYWPDLIIIHHTQQLSHRNPFSNLSLSHFGGLLYYYRKHGGWISNRHLAEKLPAIQ